MQLKDQAAIVTGGASGLGAATARRLAAQGAKVAVCDLNAKLAETVAAEIGGVAWSATFPMLPRRKPPSLPPPRRMVRRACWSMRRHRRGQARDRQKRPMALVDFDQVIRVNLIGSFNMLRLRRGNVEAGAALDGERRVVISAASVTAYDSQIGQSAYSASKGTSSR